MEELEQPNIDNNLGSNEANLGKFKDVESLLKAYNSLEAEFTKKSQKLKLLETENDKQISEQSRLADIDKRVEEFVTRFDIARPFSSALKETLASTPEASLENETIRLISNNYKRAEDYATDSEFLNNYIYSNQDIKDKIVRDYLSRITQTSPIGVMSHASSIPLTPPKVPTTIAEAGRLAKNIIKER